MEAVTEVVSKASDYLWNVILIILLCGTGIYFTIRLKFIQIRKFGEGFKLVFGNISLKGEKGKNGEMTTFQSLATAIAAQVGTGNLAGAATALIGGGPGAIFWMWVSAFFGMSTIYAEATLAQQYKVKKDGEVTGGPVYYIRAAFKGTFGKALAAIFAILIVLALGFTGNMVQSNSIGAAFSEVFSARNIEIPSIVFGLILAAVIGFIFLGGVNRLASVVEKIVPIMAGIYIVGSLVLILMNITALPGAIKMIFVGAFNPEAVVGAGAGIAVREAIRFGVARGLFSNEALAGNAGGYGLCVAIEGEAYEGHTLTTKYGHCSQILVSAGQEVKAGDVIAKVGNTGNSTGAHLHLEVLVDGQYLNPLYFADTGDTSERHLPEVGSGGTGNYFDYDIPPEALADEQFAAMMAEAEKYLGYPYVWGGASPSTSFDCSGYVSWVINNCGVGWNFGRLTADGLLGVCTPVSSADAKPGDLIFFQGPYNTSGASHVGIYVGNGMMIHCGDPISYANINTSYWQQHFYTFGRLP